MIIVRDCFQLKFGHFKEAMALVKEADDKGLFPDSKGKRVLSDFTGQAYRLILEMGFDDLGSYAHSLKSGMGAGDWQEWYERFKPHVESSTREILNVHLGA